MANKKIVRIAKLQFIAGQAKPGPELAGLGIVMPNFTKKFNDETKDRGNEPVPVQITVYQDKSFDFKLFTAPASYKILQAAKIQKGSSNSKTTKVATIDKEDVRKIAEYKLPDLNTDNIEAAMRIIAGTAKNMGILIKGMDDIEKEIQKSKLAIINSKKAAQKESELLIAQEAAKESKNKEIQVNSINQKDLKEGEQDA